MLIYTTMTIFNNYCKNGITILFRQFEVDFHFPLNANVALYIRKEALVEALIKMVEEQSNDYSLYEYIDHEVKFSNPIVVEGLGRQLERMLIS